MTNVNPLHCYFRRADFVHTCCHKGPDGDIMCRDLTRDNWINLLMMFIFIAKAVVILYIPYFIPKSLYYLEHGSTQYVYCPDRESKTEATASVQENTERSDAEPQSSADIMHADRHPQKKEFTTIKARFTESSQEERKDEKVYSFIMYLLKACGPVNRTPQWGTAD